MARDELGNALQPGDLVLCKVETQMLGTVQAIQDGGLSVDPASDKQTLGIVVVVVPLPVAFIPGQTTKGIFKSITPARSIQNHSQMFGM